jgi:hypothetical protein
MVSKISDAIIEGRTEAESGAYADGDYDYPAEAAAGDAAEPAFAEAGA